MARKERVTEIFDGDTFLTSVRKKPVRLNDVNTPEKRQQGYQDAKKALEKLIAGKDQSLVSAQKERVTAIDEENLESECSDIVNVPIVVTVSGSGSNISSNGGGSVSAP